MDDLELERLLEKIQIGHHQEAASKIKTLLENFEQRMRVVDACMAELTRQLQQAKAEYETATRRQTDELRTAMTKIENLRDEMMRAIKAADEVS